LRTVLQLQFLQGLFGIKYRSLILIVYLRAKYDGKQGKYWDIFVVWLATLLMPGHTVAQGQTDALEVCIKDEQH
jgi:hypothetical protein